MEISLTGTGPLPDPIEISKEYVRIWVFYPSDWAYDDREMIVNKEVNSFRSTADWILPESNNHALVDHQSITPP